MCCSVIRNLELKSAMQTLYIVLWFVVCLFFNGSKKKKIQVFLQLKLSEN